MTDITPFVRRAQLADTTSGREGALLVGTDTKTHLGDSTTVEAALTFIDTAMLGGVADLFGFNDLRGRTYDPFEIRSNYGLTVTRDGDVYFIDWTGEESGLSISGGQGITVEVDGSDYTIHARETRVALTDADEVTIDMANDNNFLLDMSALRDSRTIDITNYSLGREGSLLVRIEDADNVIDWAGSPVIFAFPGGTFPTLTPTPGKYDFFKFEYIGDVLGTPAFLIRTVAQNWG